jgi:AraC-like DNA-binding protein
VDLTYWWEKDSPHASETTADRRAHWRDYLARRQGTIGLAFSAPGTMATSPGQLPPDLDRARQAPLALDIRRPLVTSLVTHMRQLHANCGKWDPYDFSVLYGSALHLLGGVLNQPPKSATDRNALLAAQARERMEIHADDLRLTPDAVADFCGVSHRKLHTALTETLGVTPAALLRRIRLDRARLRLSRPGLVDMNAIARAAGYTTTRWFIDAFRRQYGQTPHEMREQLYR